ncbi:uroporphyrinogen-III synthase [Bisgaardia hudsonensis]|uniref:Uroporphyrinogen-III synthase n=1 Tax=Bisgaardia hudsonensis TaxID=109472 RepID=A0A4R2MVC7_9PAST|nr:uroporphyrinogen-III synthase [Bisgaardia hudsonensis]QLB12193.1 uroporphyrinogen-III synthase [Bisgaardia hudsonensis]TCP12231.1 uroporphyrinogen-III synthase [Bisgaardia hudsonensis]
MTVLVTRPDERGIQLVNMLNEIGIVAIHLPLFSIESGRELNSLPLQLNALDSADCVFAVSKNAVQYAAMALRNTGFLWRADLNYFAVGHRTAEYFSSQISQKVQYPILEENTEGLLAMQAMQEIENKNILVLRGNGGRDLFAEQAELRGANVNFVECYQRIPIHYDREKISLYQRSGIDKIVVTSLEALNCLMYFVFEQENFWLKNCQLITVSERIASVAKCNGWNDTVISNKSDNSTLLHTLQLLY